MDYEELAGKILSTHVLGEYVGGAWNLERIMRWIPSHVSRILACFPLALNNYRRLMILLGHYGALVFTESEEQR
jgi:hypothetical protein